MSIFQAIILGIFQGLTEFLPVSSSAHLALVPYWFNWNLPEDQVYVFGVLVQMGTLIAVLIYYWKDLIRIIRAFFTGIFSKKPFETSDARTGWFLILATIPAGLAGLFLEPLVEKAFSSPRLISVCLLVTAMLLISAEKIGKKSRSMENMSWKDAIYIGLFQVLAIFPGVSRSGSTITGGMTRNFKREDASRFSFLMSIPIMVCAGILSIVDLFELSTISTYLLPLIIATVVAGISGYLAIRWMIHYVSKKPFFIFSIYCTVIAIITLIMTFFKG